MLAEGNEVMEKAAEVMEVFYTKKEQRALYDAAFKDACDRATCISEGYSKGIEHGKSLGLAEGKSLGLAEGKAKGLAEGKREGSRQAKRETAKAFKKLGVPLATIVKGTGLSEEEIEKL